jgi:hypothetical protein
VYGIDIGLFRYLDDLRTIEVGSDRPGTVAEVIGFIGLEAMKRELVFLGIDGDRLNTEFSGRPEHPYRYLAAVGDEQPLDRPVRH